MQNIFVLTHSEGVVSLLLGVSMNHSFHNDLKELQKDIKPGLEAAGEITTYLRRLSNYHCPVLFVHFCWTV
jgi:hypothetical protein